METKRWKGRAEKEGKMKDKAEAELKMMKTMMEDQMQKAEIMVKEIEEKFRSLPNPFEDEVVELRERVEQQKVGIENLRTENDDLSLSLQRVTDTSKKEVAELEKKLAYATTVLNEVSGMKNIKGLAKMEEMLGIDIDGDGVIGDPARQGSKVVFGGESSVEGAGGAGAGGVPNAQMTEMHRARSTIAGMGAPGATNKSPKGKKMVKQKTMAQKEIEIAQAAKAKIEAEKQKLVFRKSVTEHDAIFNLTDEQKTKMEFEMQSAKENEDPTKYDGEANKAKIEADKKKLADREALAATKKAEGSPKRSGAPGLL